MQLVSAGSLRLELSTATQPSMSQGRSNGQEQNAPDDMYIQGSARAGDRRKEVGHDLYVFGNDVDDLSDISSLREWEIELVKIHPLNQGRRTT